MKHIFFSLLFLSTSFIHTTECKNFNTTFKQSKNPCNNPQLDINQHLYCEDFQHFVKLTQKRKQESQDFFCSYMFPLWKKNFATVMQMAQPIKQRLDELECLLSVDDRPQQFKAPLEAEQKQLLVLFAAMKDVTEKYNLKTIYDERHSFSTAASETIYPLVLIGTAWYLSGQPGYKELKNGFTNTISDARDINKEFSLWAVATTTAELTSRTAVPYALMHGTNQSFAVAGASLFGPSLAYKIAIQAGYSPLPDKAETILSPNAQIGAGILSAATWATIFAEPFYHSYHRYNQRNNYPFKDKQTKNNE